MLPLLNTGSSATSVYLSVSNAKFSCTLTTLLYQRESMNMESQRGNVKHTRKIQQYNASWLYCIVLCIVNVEIE